MSRTPTWRLLVVVACMMGAFVAVTLKSTTALAGIAR